MPAPIPRGPSARNYLRIEWDYPVYTPPVEESKDGQTVARKKRQALSREEAFKIIAGDDPRPLLVLRECKVCNGTDEALLKTGADNEKTFLLSRWFHCVKLPVDVLEKDHPFHLIFTQQESPEHLFVASPDGTNQDPLESQTSRTELWESMRDLLAVEYQKKPESPLKSITKLLDKLDSIDQRMTELVDRQNEILEEDGPDSKKLPKLAQKIEKVRKELDGVNKDIVDAYKIELRRQRDAKKADEQKAKEETEVAAK
ncbi:MAG: hypothetical protein H6828_07145 [Planctomycetes bacterium]|nr:hypothetical protein [Planctomycetota bacterium]